MSACQALSLTVSVDHYDATFFFLRMRPSNADSEDWAQHITFQPLLPWKVGQQSKIRGSMILPQRYTYIYYTILVAISPITFSGRVNDAQTE